SFVFWQAVAPVALGLTGHHQQTAMIKRQFAGSQHFVAAMLQLKHSRDAETQRRNYRLLSEFRFVVAVPVHTVLSIAVIICQHRIEGMTTQGFHPLPDVQQEFCPWDWCELQSGITVLRTG